MLAIGGALFSLVVSRTGAAATTKTGAASSASASASASASVSVTGSGTASASARASASSSASSWSGWDGGTSWPGHHGHHPKCFLQGTRIATPLGDVPVESLGEGDVVLTMAAGACRIRRVAQHTYTKPAFGAWHRHVHPVLIRAGAIAEDVPRRDLYVSPGHAILIDGFLMRACDLVNGTSILFAVPNDLAVVDYRHIELEDHQIILAEGTPAETMFDPIRHACLAAPMVRYDGLYANVAALLKLASPVFLADRRDPLQRTYDRIASRSRLRRAA